MKNKTGVAFPDFIRTEKLSGGKGVSYKEYRLREYFLPVFLVLIASGLLLRLFFIQILKGDYYRKLSDGNRIRTISVYAPRGAILDRNGKSLVYNTPGFRKNVLGKTKLLSTEEALTLISKGEKNLEVDTLRYYPYEEVFSHVLGYIGQISKEELREERFSDYRQSDLIGKSSIENEYELFLVGTDGKELIEVDSLGREIRRLGRTDPIPGQDIILNLDFNIQKAAFEASKKIKKGAVIVSSPYGEILALISKPSFDPNLFTMGESYRTSSSSSYRDLSSILSDGKNQPLLNRAIGGIYPPGSTFKLVVAASGLSNKIIDQNFTVEDTGRINVGTFSFSNWYFTQYGRTDGIVNIVKGIKRSNDVFFYKLGEKIGVDKISQTAANFGLGEKTGIDLSGESSGLVPTPLWKEKELGENWYLGDTYNYSIGQGFILTTPLQVNSWTGTIANGGDLYRPHLMKNDKSNKPVEKGVIPRDAVELIREGMRQSCSPGGVAWPLFEFTVKNSKLKVDGRNYLEAPKATVSSDFKDYRKISMACKTGTAEHGGKETLPHAWITLFAPAYDPEIVVTILSEESGEGSNVAAPIAKKILEDYFGRKN